MGICLWSLYDLHLILSHIYISYIYIYCRPEQHGFPVGSAHRGLGGTGVCAGEAQVLFLIVGHDYPPGPWPLVVDIVPPNVRQR